MTGRRALRMRLAATGGLFAAVFVVLIGRAVQLTVLDGPALRAKANRQHTQRVSTLPQRGPIVDRYGEALALTRESVAVSLRPRELKADASTLAAVAELLDLPPGAVAEKAASRAPFVWLSRQVAPDRWAAIERLGVPGIGSEPTRQRVYPRGPLAGHVLGFTGIDGQGLEGIERVLDADLRGEVEALDVERDARGRRMVVHERWRPLPRVGARVELTLDAGLQHVAEAELEAVVAEFGAEAASAIVLAPETGEVLAMASVPRIDPNHFGSASPAQWRNRLIADSYEPGSTFKAILAAEAMESGLVAPQEKIFCENGHFPVGRRVIHDSHPHGTLEFADVIAQSSNIGSAKVAERLGRERFGAALARFGFGRPTGIDLPGEVAGLLRPTERWGRIHLITTAFGQGIAVTPLQLVRAFAAIANGGRLMRPYAVRRIVEENGHVRYAGQPHVDAEVISPESAAQVTAMLRRVVEAGTGGNARIEGISVAGKTGTAQKVDPVTRRYHARARMSSFVGFVPAEHPQLVILVVVDTPKKATYGGVVAAPVFRRIAEYGLERRGIMRRAAPRRALPPPAAPPLLGQSVTLVSSESPASLIGGTPSFLGLSMREALVRAQRGGWRVQVDGSGYVVAQEPPPGSAPSSGELMLTFGSGAS